MKKDFGITNKKSANGIEAGELIQIPIPEAVLDRFKGMTVRVVKPRVKFVEWLKKNRWTKSALARQLGVSRQTVHRFCDGGTLKKRNMIRLIQLVEKTDGTDVKELL